MSLAHMMPGQPGMGTANGANVINMLPRVYTMKLQHKFYKKTSLLDVANTDYEGEIKGSGSEVIIRTAPEVAVHNYIGKVEYQELLSGQLKLQINKAKYYAFKEDLVQSKQADIKYINAAAEAAAKKMAIEVESDVYSNISADFLPSHTITADVNKGNILDVLLAGSNTLDESDVDEEGRNLLLPPSICTMLKLSDLKNANQMGDPQSVIRNGGKLGQIDRWNIICSTNLPFDSSTGEYTAMGMTKHFLSFASQFEQHEIVQLESTFGKGHRGLKVYGYKGGVVPESGVQFKLKAA